LGLNPTTATEKNCHILPPEPEEEVKSTIRSSQGPISLAMETVITGAFTTSGAEIVKFWGSLDFQLEQEGSILEVQRAFSSPSLNNQRSRPTLTDDPIEETTSEETVSQEQREVIGRFTESNNKPQLNPLIRPPRFVGEVKVTMILLPSEENSDRCIEGGGKASSTPFTTNTSPAGNTTL
jgi:hypothetical protein